MTETAADDYPGPLMKRDILSTAGVLCTTGFFLFNNNFFNSYRVKRHTVLLSESPILSRPTTMRASCWITVTENQIYGSFLPISQPKWLIE